MISWLNKYIMPFMIMAGIPTGFAFWQMKDANDSIGLTFIIVAIVSLIIIMKLLKDWVEDTEDITVKKSKRWKYRAGVLALIAFVFKMVSVISLDIEGTLIVMSGSIGAGSLYIDFLT